MTNVFILVVDDNLVSRLLPGFILRSYNMLAQVIDCETAEDAMRMLQIHPVTHILLDISMPDMTGLELAKRIRSQEKYSNVKLIAYTANAKDDNVLLLTSEGFNDVLLKPLKSADLLAVLNLTIL